MDAGQDVVRSLGPAEWFRVCIGSLEISFDRVFEINDGAEHASPEGTFSQQRKEAFDLVDPSRRCRGEVHVPARTLGERVADQLCFVRAVVVHDGVNIEIGGHIALNVVLSFKARGSQRRGRWRVPGYMANTVRRYGPNCAAYTCHASVWC